MAKKKAVAEEGAGGVSPKAATKKSKPKEKNPPRKAAQLLAYASDFGDWAEKTRRQMRLAAERLESFDEDFEVILITSMIDKLMVRISTRVRNQFGEDANDASKLSKDIRAERGLRKFEAEFGKRPVRVRKSKPAE